jgi:hypothetical protein
VIIAMLRLILQRGEVLRRPYQLSFDFIGG